MCADEPDSVCADDPDKCVHMILSVHQEKWWYCLVDAVVFFD